MPDFETYSIVKWLHVLCMALGGGAAMIILILVGFEDGREDLKGMTSILWKRTAAWAFRLAVVLGVVLLVLRFRMGDHPFEARYLHLKLALVVLLLAFSELSGRALARARRSCCSSWSPSSRSTVTPSARCTMPPGRPGAPSRAPWRRGRSSSRAPLGGRHG